MIFMKNNLKDIILIFLGVFCACFSLNSFLIPNSFIDGGVTGVSLLLKEVFEINLSILLMAINAPFIYLGYKQIGKTFAIKVFLSISLLALAVSFIKLPVITNDKLLIAVFGGVFLGSGIGLAIRGGSAIDGTEILAIYLSKKTRLTIGDIILIINIFIFLFASILLGIDNALYSMLTYISASKAVDFIVNGLEEYTGITIISEKSNLIRKVLVEKGYGVTIFKGKSGYSENETDIVFTVVTRLEISKIHSEIKEIDENVFLIESSINDTTGGLINKRKFH